MFNENQLIGQDTNGRDGWSLAWRYQDEPLLAHLTVAAVGANGTDSPWVTLGLHHPDPVARILSVTTTPTLPTEGGFLRLPVGAGKLLFQVRAVNTQKVRFLRARPAPTPRPGCLRGHQRPRRLEPDLALPGPTPDRPPHHQGHRTRRGQPRHRPRPLPPRRHQLTPPTGCGPWSPGPDRWLGWTGPGTRRGRPPSVRQADCQSYPCQSRRRMRSLPARIASPAPRRQSTRFRSGALSLRACSLGQRRGQCSTLFYLVLP